MKYLVVDADLSGTGVRDRYPDNGDSYCSPEELGLTQKTIEKLSKWLLKYQNERTSGYRDNENIEQLDLEG